MKTTETRTTQERFGKGTRINAITVAKLFAAGVALSIVCSAIPGCQSRGVSRVSGRALKLELPKDFSEPISFASGREGEKDLFYKATDGTYKVKTFTDSGFFESSIQFIAK